MNKVSFNGEWQLYYTKEKEGYVKKPSELFKSDYAMIDATVPGNVESDLVKTGLEADPYFGENTLAYMKYEYYQWWYTKSILVPKDIEGDRLVLRFNGIDTIADIFIEDTMIGHTENMLVEHDIDVTDYMTKGRKYRITVCIYSAMDFIKGKGYTVWMRGCRHCSELPYLRKAPHMMGWDILPRLVSAGLWKDVELIGIKNTRLTETYYATPVFNIDDIRMRFAYRFVTDHDTLEGFSIRVTGKCEDSSFEYSIPAWFISGNDGFMIKNPRLWWPRGYGGQPVYTVTMDLLYKDEVVDSKTEKIGLRTFRLERRFDRDDQEFKMYVNGVPIFINGTNWVALDILHSRDKDRERKAVELCADANCNMIRCWGGNVYPESTFFDACDELGIMVWQDFALGNSNYPQTDEFYATIEEEAGKVMRKFRNHPSLVLWCGDNEIDATLAEYWYPEYNSKYNRVSREVLSKCVQQHDPFRFFLKSSPEIPEGYNAYDVPEQHIWGHRAYFKDDFYKHPTAKFIAESGYHGCPDPESIAKFIPKDKLWPFDNTTWAHHSTEDILIEDVLGRRNRLMADQVRILIGEMPEDLATFSVISQMSQAEAFKFFIERSRINKWDSTGILWWNMLDGWPAISDAVVDYYFKKKMAYDVIKRVQEPVCVMMDELKGWTHGVFVANDTNKDHTLSYSIYDNETGKDVFSGSHSIDKGHTVKVGEISELAGTQHLYLIEWMMDGRKYRNHYISGFPSYRKEKILEWAEVIKKLI